MQVNFFVFDRAPQSFNEYIITPGTFAVHTDPDAMVLEQASECQGSKLADLVGVRDLRIPVISARTKTPISPQMQLTK